MKSDTLASGMARAFLADGPWTAKELVRRGALALGEAPPFLRTLARLAVRTFERPPHDDLERLTATLRDAPALARGIASRPGLRVRRWLSASPRGSTPRWDLPPLDTVSDAAALVGVSLEDLRWLADPKGLTRRPCDEKLRSYRYAFVEKPSGGFRVIEAPKPRLCALQRRLLDAIVARIPAHEAAHGFVAGRSPLTFAAPHAGKRLVVRFDLEDFFGSITGGRVVGIFRAAGYPIEVARLLQAVTTTRVPIDVWAGAPRPRHAAEIAERHARGRKLARPHLPQGAPTSPALANLAAHRLDVRLAGLAARAGLAYTRYADDLAFSGEKIHADGFTRTVADIARDEGFVLSSAKSRIMGASGRQHLAGLVVNDRPRVARDEVDALRALLHDARHNGVDAANRAGVPDLRAHVAGRIAWVAASDAKRGERLWGVFREVAW